MITKICELGACFLYFSYVLAENGGLRGKVQSTPRLEQHDSKALGTTVPGPRTTCTSLSGRIRPQKWSKAFRRKLNTFRKSLNFFLLTHYVFLVYPLAQLIWKQKISEHIKCPTFFSQVEIGSKISIFLLNSASTRRGILSTFTFWLHQQGIGGN